jgi:hypothetical protein
MIFNQSKIHNQFITIFCENYKKLIIINFNIKYKLYIIEMDILSLESIQDLTKKINSSSEFEIIFNKKNPLSINKYIDISKYLIHLSIKNKFKLLKESTLDIGFTNYVNKDIVNYRISINSIETILYTTYLFLIFHEYCFL